MSLTPFFSQRFGYALHTLCFLAKKPEGSLTTGPELTAWMQEYWPSTSESYLTAVIQRMVRGGLLRSHRGKSGGYSLPRRPIDITLRDIICQLEGVQMPQCNLAPSGSCPVHVGCGLLHRLKNLEESFLNLLQEVNLAELSREIGVGIASDTITDEMLPIVS